MSRLGGVVQPTWVPIRAALRTCFAHTKRVMGNRPSRSTKKTQVAFVPPGMDLKKGNDGKVYMLKQFNPGCTRCTFWRADPRTKVVDFTAGGPMINYPKHGAVLRGTPIVDDNGKQWLIVTHLAQNGGRGGWNYAPPGAAMPFESSKYRLSEVGVTL